MKVLLRGLLVLSASLCCFITPAIANAVDQITAWSVNATFSDRELLADTAGAPTLSLSPGKNCNPDAPRFALILKASSVNVASGQVVWERKLYFGEQEDPFISRTGQEYPTCVLTGTISVQGNDNVLFSSTPVQVTYDSKNTDLGEIELFSNGGDESAPAGTAQNELGDSSTNSNFLGDIAGVLVAILGAAAAAALVVLLLWFLPRKVAKAAERKGRNYRSWFWIAFFFLIPSAIIVAIMRNDSNQEVMVVTPQSPPLVPMAEEATKDCPFCGEQILAIAKKCKHCGEFVEPQS